jgi:hypothetical protein
MIIAWAIGDAEAKIVPNLLQATPGHAELPPR